MEIWQDDFCSRMDEQIKNKEINDHYEYIWSTYKEEILEYCEDAINIYNIWLIKQRLIKEIKNERN